MNQADEKPQPSATPSLAPPDGHQILIVDDDRQTAKALAALLAVAGFQTTVMHTGREALRFAKKQHPSAAIIDVHLPDLNGLVLSANLREELGDTAPIFVVSGDTSMETLNSLPHVGATHFFAKPMSAPYVIQRLKACLDGNAEG